MQLEGDPPHERAFAAPAVRRLAIRVAFSVAILGALAWVARHQPFFGALIRAASIVLALVLLGWVLRAGRRSHGERRAAERRHRARRGEQEVEVPGEGSGPP